YQSEWKNLRCFDAGLCGVCHIGRPSAAVFFVALDQAGFGCRANKSGIVCVANLSEFGFAWRRQPLLFQPQYSVATRYYATVYGRRFWLVLMAIILIIVGIILFLTAIRGTTAQFGNLLLQDLFGGFVYWFGAIIVIGLIGYIKPLRPLSNALLVLV